MKTVWITAFDKEKDAARVAAVSQLLKRYGLATQGHFWVDEPAKLAWRAPASKAINRCSGGTRLKTEDMRAVAGG